MDEEAFGDWEISKVSKKTTSVPIDNSELDQNVQVDDTSYTTELSDSSNDSPPRRLRSLNEIY